MGSKRLIVPGRKRLALPTQGLPSQPLTPTQPFMASPALVGRPPETRDELFWFILACWGVAIPRQRVCPDHTPPFEALAEAFFGEKSVTIWIGSRGFGGKTKTLSILGMTEMVALGAFVTILGGSGQQSLRVHETMSEAWEHPGAPTDLLAKDPTQLSTFLTNGAKARTLMASTKSVRGPHPQRMRLDEIDEMDMNVLESAQGQPMSTKKIKSQTVMSSTHQYPNGTVTGVLRRADELGWPVRRWCLVAGSMVTTDKGLVPIEKIRGDEKVVGWNGESLTWGEISWAGFTKVASTVVVRTASGREIRCTSDHQILTANGWQEAGALTNNDFVVCEMPVLSASSTGGAEELCAKHNRHVSSVLSDSPCSPESVCVRCSQGEAIQDVPVLLSARDGATEHGGQGNACSQTCRCEEGQDRIEIGSSGCGASYGSTDSISGTGANWNLCGGLSERENSDRGSGVAAHPSNNSGARRTKESLAGKSGVHSNRIVVQEPSSLVAEVDRVVSVTPGEVEAVYDLSVPGLHSFVANGIVVHNCFLETSNPIDGWLNPEEIERKRSEIPRHMWESEYELFEPSFDSRAIEPQIVERAFDLSLGYAEGEINTEVIVQEPLYNRDYVTAVDWAKAKDYTVVWTFDTTVEPWRTVAFARMGRRPWPDMVGYVNKRIAKYPGKLVHDATGIGSVIDDYIEIPDTMSEADVIPIIMAGRARNDMITNYVSALENQLIVTPRIKYVYEEHKFASVDDLYNGTSKAHLPDSIAAGALGWSQRNTWAMDFAEPTVMTRPASPWQIR